MDLWEDICSIEDLQPNSGVCALVNNQQVAIFYIPEDQAIYAISNYDPIGEANVLSRGIIGDIQGQMYIASPLYKQHYNLQSGACLEQVDITIPTFAIRINATRVEINVGDKG